jgi:exodeoxyribonuclease VII large subunit
MITETPIAAPAGSNRPVLSVGELSLALKRSIERDFGHVRVRGEISGCRAHGSGHVYLALKDTEALLDAVIWRGVAQRLGIRPEDGMEVIATGRLTTFPGRSRYQLVIEQLELAGEGALLKLLEDRKRRLAAEGLFAAERKRPLPYLPGVIGIVTSPSGAVIRDILHRLAERFPRRVLLWPVAVQGEGAADQIARAIAGFNALAPDGAIPRPDLLIVARGGGSLEDLMAFNEEVVVRAAAASLIPLISAVGHETDTTLIDFAADRRAPTPTAAAEMAVPVRLDLLRDLRTLGHRLDGAAIRLLDERRLRLDGLARGLPDPAGLLDTAMQRLDDRAERLGLAMAGRLRDWRARLAETAGKLRHPREQLAEATRQLDREAALLRPALDRALERTAETLNRLGQLLDSLSPFKVLERGYAVVEDRAGHKVEPAEIVAGMALTLRFCDANVAARAESPALPLGTPAPPSGPRRRTARKEAQPSLF